MKTSNYYISRDHDGKVLCHHGIKGQKWGVRRFQDERGRWTPAGRERYGKGGQPRVGMDPMTAYILAYTTLATAVVATQAYRVHKDNKRVYPELDEKDVPRIQNEHSKDDDQYDVNYKAYRKGLPGSNMNCACCSTAYDLRRRGYDVKARLNQFGKTYEKIEKWYVDGKFTKYEKGSDHRDMIREIMKQPEGSRGNLCVTSEMGFAHSMAYEVENGEMVIRDAQNHTMYRGQNEIMKFMQDYVIDPSRSGYMRTDNLEVNWKTVSEAVVNKSVTDIKQMR